MSKKITSVEVAIIIGKFDGVEVSKDIYQLPNGAEISVTKQRIYVLNPAECLTDSDFTGEFITRKSDGAEGIKFLNATTKEDIATLIGHVAKLEISEPDNSIQATTEKLAECEPVTSDKEAATG